MLETQSSKPETLKQDTQENNNNYIQQKININKKINNFNQ